MKWASSSFPWAGTLGVECWTKGDCFAWWNHMLPGITFVFVHNLICWGPKKYTCGIVIKRLKMHRSCFQLYNRWQRCSRWEFHQPSFRLVWLSLELGQFLEGGIKPATSPWVMMMSPIKQILIAHDVCRAICILQGALIRSSQSMQLVLSTPFWSIGGFRILILLWQYNIRFHIQAWHFLVPT